jgi:hypothetical protein
MTWMLPLSSLLTITLFVSPASADMPSAPHTALDPLKFLIGEWQGTRPDGQALRVTYQLTSGGSALLETIMPEKEPSMTTLYHVDGRHLMLTHYCSLGNQPRMIADLPRGEVKTLRFSFLDATNLESPTSPHMHKVTFTVQDKDHFTQEWVLSKDGKEMPMVFIFERKR